MSPTTSNNVAKGVRPFSESLNRYVFSHIVIFKIEGDKTQTTQLEDSPREEFVVIAMSMYEVQGSPPYKLTGSTHCFQAHHFTFSS